MQLSPSGNDALVGELIKAPLANKNDLDIEFISKVLQEISLWLMKKNNMGNSLDVPGGQPFDPNFGPRNYGDPMSNFIAGLGRS